MVSQSSETLAVPANEDLREGANVAGQRVQVWALAADLLKLALF